MGKKSWLMRPLAAALALLLAALAALAPGLAGTAAAVTTSDDDIASGTSGTCEWVIDADGTLTIGAGTLESTTSSSGWGWYKYRSKIKKAVFEDGVVASSSTAWMFYEQTNLVSIENASGLDTSAVTGMSYMFYYCSSLSSLDVSGWDASAVTGMSYMFYYCPSLASLDVSGWDTSAVTKMGYMFYGCSSLSSLDVSGWDTSAATGMGSMFRGCSSLASLDVSGWDTSSVTSIYRMFYGCSSLASLDVSGWDTSNVTTMEEMFYNCSALLSLDASGWDTSAITSMRYMFYKCTSLLSLDLSGWDTSNVTTMYHMFTYCSSLSSLDLSGWDTSNVDYMDYMFTGCTALRTVVVGSKFSFEGDGHTSCNFPLPVSSTLGTGWWVSDTGAVYKSAADIPSYVPATYTAAFGGPLDGAVLKLSGSYTYTGSAIEPSVTVTLDGAKLTKGTDYTVSYSNNTDAGTATVTVTGMGDYSGTATASFTISAKSISSATVTLSTTSYTYNGSARKPTPTVKLSLNGSTVKLTKGTDYTVSYSSNKNAGTATCKVTGCGNYTGTVKKTFTIKAKSVSSATVKLSYTSTTYSGKAKKPSVKSVKLTLNGSTKTLTKGTDYTVSYSSNTKVGTATVKITGTGNYKGTVKKTFKIKPKTVSVKSVKSSAAKKATVKWTKLSSANVTKYQIRYRVKGTSTWKTIKVSSSKSSYTLTGLKSGKTYQVQVRAYKTVSGTNYVGSWSSTKTVKVK